MRGSTAAALISNDGFTDVTGAWVRVAPSDNTGES